MAKPTGRRAYVRGVYRTGKSKVSAAAVRAIRECARVLYGDAPAVSPDELLAMREQVRLDDEAKRSRQGCLVLRGGA